LAGRRFNQLYSFISNLITTINWVWFRKGKPRLESVQAANTRKILINLSSARTIIDRMIQRSTDSTQLRDLRNLLTILTLQVLKPDQTNFKNEIASLEEWNAAEKALIESSEKLALEFERQLSSSIEIAAMKYYIYAVGSAILNRKPVTLELSKLFVENLKKEYLFIKIPDHVSSELDLYLNSLLIKYSSFSPKVLHTGEYPHEVKWEHSSGHKSVTAILSNRFGISLEFEIRWQDSNDLAGLVQKESISVKKNHYKCLCLVNTSWDRKSRGFARRFSYPKLSLYLYDLNRGLYYNKNDAAAKHYEFWFNSDN
jgi:hypothetical protein